MLLACAMLLSALAEAAGGADTMAPTRIRGAAVRSWHFAVLLEDTPVGFHDFSVTTDADATIVNSHASFSVSRFRIPLYRYEQSDREVWRRGCVSEIDAETRENGRRSLVRGSLVRGSDDQDTLEVQTSGTRAAYAGCVWTYAYWDPRVLSQRRLLNAQTGEYQAIEVNRTGQEVITVRGKQVAAEHCILHAPEFSIGLWYSEQGEWLALEARTSSGAKLRYQLQ